MVTDKRLKRKARLMLTAILDVENWYEIPELVEEKDRLVSLIGDMKGNEKPNDEEPSKEELEKAYRSLGAKDAAEELGIGVERLHTLRAKHGIKKNCHGWEEKQKFESIDPEVFEREYHVLGGIWIREQYKISRTSMDNYRRAHKIKINKDLHMR